MDRTPTQGSDLPKRRISGASNDGISKGYDLADHGIRGCGTGPKTERLTEPVKIGTYHFPAGSWAARNAASPRKRTCRFRDWSSMAIEIQLSRPIVSDTAASDLVETLRSESAPLGLDDAILYY